MRLWRRQRRGDQPRPEPMSDKQRLEQLLYRLADVIGDDDEHDRSWSGKVRACADQVRAGDAWGLRNFLGLFGGMGSINDHASPTYYEEISARRTRSRAISRETTTTR